MDTFYWHDYETWGTNPSVDLPSQFAGIRTDLDFNIIGDPLNILCRPNLDTIPHTEACLVTGILPQDADKNGLNEREFFSRIFSEMIKPNTCTLGFNSLRFDDEVTRYGYFRNFFDPYEREWKNNNSRWDIIDLVRLCYALRPHGISWPLNDQGEVSFKLEDLTRQNNLTHEDAHDALSDVYATIALAKLIKKTHSKLFNYIFNIRKKENIKPILKIGSNKPLLHISSFFGKKNLNMSIILPICENKKNKNEIICVDLRYSPDILIESSEEEIYHQFYENNNDIKLPLFSIYLNRCPILLTTKLLTPGLADRAFIDTDQCNLNLKKYKNSLNLKSKLENVFQKRVFPVSQLDSEQRLYDKFIPDSDRFLIKKIPYMNSNELLQKLSFEDDRLSDLFFRYRARNFSDTLSDQEKKVWNEYCYNKCLKGSNNPLARELKIISDLIKNNPESAEFLNKLCDYLNDKSIYIKENFIG
tara:strand:+ start:823 stop:2241 length:1419 start_codon:yes stop_codon:yes gene_type:complete